MKCLVGQVNCMERLSNYISGAIELVLVGVIYLIALPFRVLYNLTQGLHRNTI